METKITRLCGGYYRSFTRFRKAVEKMEDKRTFLEDCACFLLESPDKVNDPLKVRFTQRFFETYGQWLAGNCGCSHLILDHKRVRIVKEELFMNLMQAALAAGLFDCSKVELANVLFAGFKFNIKLKTIKNKLRGETLRGEKLQGVLKKWIKK